MRCAFKGAYMKQKNKAETAGTEAGQKADSAVTSAKRVTKVKAKAKTKTISEAKASKTRSDSFDFVGKVESLIVTGGSGAEAFEFGLRNRNGERQAFRLRTSDSFSMSIMAPIVIAAHAADAKIGVRAAADETGVRYVMEVARRPKLGKA